MPVMQPYKHDCDECIWVGWIHVNRGGKFGSSWGNMYFCHADQSRPHLHSHPGSVIIRFSDEPSDYWSRGIGECVKGAIKI